MALDPAVRYSHPPEDGRDGVLLVSHLRDVARRVDHVVPAHATTPNGESLREVVRRLALVHDLGKATTWFQQYLDRDRRDPPNDALRYHAPIGSFAAYFVLDDAGYEPETCLAGFVAVAKHHGQLPDVLGYVYDRTTGDRQGPGERVAALKQQAVDINDDATGVAEAVFADATGDSDDWLAFARSLLEDSPDSLLDRLSGLVSRNGQEARDIVSESCYGLVLRCWSALVLADKTSAAGAAMDAKTYEADVPTRDTLDAYIDGLDADPDPNGTRVQRLDYCRDRARETVVSAASEFAESGNGVATLTLPTGMGKTLTGLSAAFTVRDAMDGERVVYALPFTSIIDQVVDELETIYDTDGLGRLLTAHHHLETAAIYDDTVDGENAADEAERADDVAAMLGESWRAGLTVTTFVQLFESLAGPRNTQSMKLPALQDSVVVLDEPQSLPLDWWKLAPRLAELLVEQYDATVIAMTATQPRLFADEFGEVPELVDDEYDYFDAVERVTYRFDESIERYLDAQEGAKSYADAAAALRTIPESDSVLSVTNTIDSARELTERVLDGDFVDVGDVYARLLDRLGGDADASDIDAAAVTDAVIDEDGRPVLHLSTRLRPVDRLTLVEAAKELTACDCGLVVVSTQLIEAGVDISFDRVYRDFAPLDSIVQAAGRCNRSFEQERGQVTVWWLDAPDDESETTPAAAVYNRGTKLLPVTADAISAVRERVDDLDETALAKTAVEEYYERLGDGGRDVGKREYAQYVDDARADELGQLSLIDQHRAVDVLVCRTDADRDLADAIRDADAAYEFDRLDQLLEETKPRRVSIPVYHGDDETEQAIERLVPLIEDDGLYELDVRDHSNYFDETTGFVVPESTVAHQFL